MCFGERRTIMIDIFTTSQTRHKPQQLDPELGRIEKCHWGPVATAGLIAAGGSMLGGSLLSGMGSKDPEMRQAPTLTPEQQALLKKIIGEIEPHIGKGVEPYPGTTVPSEQFLQDYYSGATGIGKDPLYAKAGLALEKGLAGAPDEAAAKEHWEDVFYKPAMTRLKQDILPQLREDYAGLGGYDSGGRRRAETRAAGRVATETSGQLADVLYKEKQQAIDRALETARYVPEHLGVPLGYKKDVGIMRTGFEGERLGEKKEKWQAKQPWASPYLRLGMEAIGKQATEPYLYQPKTPWYGQLGQAAMGAGTIGLGYGLGQKIAA